MTSIPNLPYEIDYFIARHRHTGKEYEFAEYGLAQAYCDFYNEEEKNWEIYAKIKDAPTTLPKLK